jgi:hypothetical protein
MGRFYTNILLKGVTATAVRSSLEKMRRRAFMKTAGRGIVVVYDAKCEQQDTKDLCELARGLSSQLRCVSWGLLNHDDDVLWYVLCDCGKYADSYNSAPDYFDDDAALEPAPPEGGNARTLAKLLNCRAAASKIERILRSAGDAGVFTFETDRHRALARALRLPAAHLIIGYDGIERNELSPRSRRQFHGVGVKQSRR